MYVFVGQLQPMFQGIQHKYRTWAAKTKFKECSSYMIATVIDANIKLTSHKRSNSVFFFFLFVFKSKIPFDTHKHTNKYWNCDENKNLVRFWHTMINFTRFDIKWYEPLLCFRVCLWFVDKIPAVIFHGIQVFWTTSNRPTLWCRSVSIVLNGQEQCLLEFPQSPCYIPNKEKRLQLNQFIAMWSIWLLPQFNGIIHLR